MATKIISDAEIAAAARAGGFRGEEVVMAVAIALAETNPKGNIYSHNAVPPDNSYGLMQINMLGDMGPERRKRFGLKSNEDLYDPVTNMRVAKALKDGRGNWKDWSTYLSGAYFAYLPRARKAAGSPASSVPGTSGSATPIKNDVSYEEQGFFDILTNPQTWLRVAMVVGGGISIVIALAVMTNTTSAIPITKVAKLAKAVK